MPPQNMIFSQNHEITRGRGILQEAPKIQKRHQVIDLLNMLIYWTVHRHRVRLSWSAFSRFKITGTSW
jgi:hypothetical protein